MVYASLFDLAVRMKIDSTAKIINCIRALSIDAVEKANSGHPGTPMALAPVAFKLWDGFVRHNPSNPAWPARDRFVLSAGHASMLLYSVLHISGYGVSIDDIKRFRRLGGKCAGHPEHGLIAGIETTTGPLGQGAATSVGMAAASRWLSQRFDRPGFEIAGYRVFSILSDGDMMEGITSEAASLAAHLGLDNLVWIYDDNSITIDGKTDISFSEDVTGRFAAYGWDVFSVPDANDLAAVENALAGATGSRRPALVRVKSRIGFGSPGKENTPEAHGAPLGPEESGLAKKAYGFDGSDFHTPPEVEQYRRSVIEKGGKLEEEWNALFAEYAKEHPGLASEFRAICEGSVPDGWDTDLPVFEPGTSAATRTSNGKIMEEISAKIPWFMGGAADVADSTKTLIKPAGSFSAEERSGRNFHFGVREHSMAAFCNGLALCGLRPYASCYFVFSDYLKPALRLSALMRQPVVYVFTHDSIGVGEDGPTHQPVEHLAALRATPGLDVIRPADGNELRALWPLIISSRKPAALVLTRQNVPALESPAQAGGGPEMGAYIVADCAGGPEIIIIATGSEVFPCVCAHRSLAGEGVRSRVVSMPSWEIFERQSRDYRDGVLPPEVTTRLSVEAASTLGWERYTGAGRDSFSLGIDRFGESAPGGDVMKAFGFDEENIASLARRLIGRE